MGQLGRDFDFAQEALRAERRANLRLHDLEGDPTGMLEVVRQEHDRHTTLTDLVVDAVAVECSVEARAEVRHLAEVTPSNEGRSCSAKRLSLNGTGSGRVQQGPDRCLVGKRGSGAVPAHRTPHSLLRTATCVPRTLSNYPPTIASSQAATNAP